jgi:predicted Ser/Thr protein kinase
MTTPVFPDQLFLNFQQALAGRYSLDRELGRGGMGVVYLAREVHLDRLVAIKLLPPHRAATPGLRERFLREARLAAKLSHPNIIPIHSVEDTGEFVFFVMAYVEGETLAQRVATRGPLPSAEGARVLREVAWALAYAHGQGVVHRDIKPDNVLLEGATARVLVADFGIAGAFGATGSEDIAGTPEFMSPEQALGNALDARSDLYSLGATAFYAFSGRLPLSGATHTEVLAKQVTEPAPPLLSTGMPVPRKLAALVDRCLMKEPHQRPESAQALAEQLGVAIERKRDLPVALRSFVKRNARLDGGGTLIVGFLLLPTATAVGSYFGAIAGFGVIGLGAIAAPFAYLVAQARTLLRLGFDHQDLRPAFHAEMEQSREELAISPLQPPSILERVMPSLARMSAALSGLSTVAAVGLFTYMTTQGRVPFALGRALNESFEMGVATAIFAFGTTLLTSIGALAYKSRRSDVDTEFWSRIWSGRIGRDVFTTAKRFLGKRVVQNAMTHRATELSLGMAAEQLYESLPRATRQSLRDLPEIMRRLQDDAQLLRRRHDELHDAIAAAGEAATSADYAGIRATRDEMHAKLGEAVGALETIRLNLLRLHAGSLSVQGLTTHLGLAAEVSEQVERLVEAHDELDRFRYPAPPTPTPV